MWKSPIETNSRYSSIRRNQQIRRILLLLSMIVMLVLTGLLINGHGLSQSLPASDITKAAPSQAPLRQNIITSNQKDRSQDETSTPVRLNMATPTPALKEDHPTKTADVTQTPTETNQEVHTGIIAVQDDDLRDTGTLFLSIDEDGYKHIFAYHPQTLPYTRLTNGSWDDIHPSIDSSGTLLAFSSNRNGYWDIYVMELNTGTTFQITDTTEYDGAPSWSPDSSWLVYESYSTLEAIDTTNINDPLLLQDLDIFIRQVDLEQPQTTDPVRLTDHPGVDFAPAWSPTGRKIAFASARSGQSDIWMADLDRIDDRFINISQNPGAFEAYPAWSQDGNSLSWTSKANGNQDIYVYDFRDNLPQAKIIGTGSRPVWSPDGSTLVTSLNTPNRTYITGYSTDSDGLALPPIPITGPLAGITWSRFQIPDPLPDVLEQIAISNPNPSWFVKLENNQGSPGERRLVVPILDVEAPYPMLQDMVNESFIALRQSLMARIGWDYLSSLENAYVPLTSPLSPGMLEDWLYTGRAYSLNPAVVNAGWMVVMREDFGSETYWRIFLRARFQDGSQGRPLHELPWDLYSRYSGDPRTYEHGGAPASIIPPGYWVDFTDLAASKGWERLPALSTWRSAITSARFNEFVLTDGLDWYSAMLEIYPPEALNLHDQSIQ